MITSSEGIIIVLSYDNQCDPGSLSPGKHPLCRTESNFKIVKKIHTSVSRHILLDFVSNTLQTFCMIIQDLIYQNADLNVIKTNMKNKYPYFAFIVQPRVGSHQQLKRSHYIHDDM